MLLYMEFCEVNMNRCGEMLELFPYERFAGAVKIDPLFYRRYGIVHTGGTEDLNGFLGRFDGIGEIAG